jgi:hypothetical protein
MLYFSGMTTTLRARYDGKVLIPVGQIDLPVGQEVQLQVVSDASGPPVVPPPVGSGPAIVEAMAKAPHLSPGDVDELERLIEEGKLPVREEGIFDDLDEPAR